MIKDKLRIITLDYFVHLRNNNYCSGNISLLEAVVNMYVLFFSFKLSFCDTNIFLNIKEICIL